MDEIYKEVYFNEYCPTCIHKNTKNTEEPCNECLANPTNTYSHKPVNWTEKNKRS